MKIYIAGKVTGLPTAEVAAKFEAAQQELESHGFVAINPVKVVNDPNAPWSAAMRLCLVALLQCDAVYLLPCYINSRGANFEVLVANQVGIPVCTKIEGFYQYQLPVRHIY